MRVTTALKTAGLSVAFCLGAWFVEHLWKAGIAQAMVSQNAATAELTGRIWQAGKAEKLGAAAYDGDERTYAVITPESRDAEVGVGLEWTSDRRVSALRVAYATLNGMAYEALPDHQSVEYWDGQVWQPLEAQLRIDYRRDREFAFYQKSGLVSWEYRFSPVNAKGIRIRLNRAVSQLRWDQRYVIREFTIREAGTAEVQLAPIVVVGRETASDTDIAASNLALDSAGAVRSHDGEGSVVTWPRPRMVSELAVPLPQLPGALQWWDGGSWTNIPLTRIEQGSSPPRAKAHFLPIAVEQLRVVGLTAAVPLELRADSAGSYFDSVYRSGQDLLMERILQGKGDPDFAGVASLLLPLDMQTSVIGRPGDPVECMVHWNGTLVETEGGDLGAWNHGAKTTIPGKDQWIDRWFAFAADGELFGSNIDRTSRSYLDGFLPAVVTRYSKGEMRFEEEVFTSAPGDPLYAQCVTLRIANRGKTKGKATLAVIAGRRISASAAHRASPEGGAPSPMTLEPLDAGYRFDADRQTVRNAANQVVLYALAPFERTGNPQEPVLSYTVELAPGSTRELYFVLPSVNEPVSQVEVLRDWKPQEGRERFRRYWSQQLLEKVKVNLPESPLNDIYRNLVAQAMIILSDGQKLKYGAYWYEAYFGVEEGWPITALAQFGHADVAKSAIRIMLSPELTDKSNYHHQYRNGLAPMYAAQVYRLARDRDWLREIVPRLKESAEWIVKARHQSDGRSEDYEGLLPRHAYGGDVHTPAYSIYSNATCWRGLQDAAYLLREAGESALAETYATDAAAYRQRIEEIVSKYANHQVTPPFVPLALDIGTPGTESYKKVEAPYSFIPSDDLGNYWILFAPLTLETGVFPADGKYSRWVTDFMEQRGGLLAGLARFYRGVDHIYGFAYPLQLVERGERRKFLATVYSVLAHGNSRDSFTSPEVAGVFPLRTDNRAWQEAFRRTVWNWDLYGSGWMQEQFGEAIGAEPLSAGAGMALQLIRKMMITEETDKDGHPTGKLELLRMAPSHWFEDGKKIEVATAPTVFGQLSMNLESQLSRRRMFGKVEPGPDFAAGKLTLWLRHPKGLPIKAVRINQSAVSGFKAEAIDLPTNRTSEFEVEF